MTTRQNDQTNANRMSQSNSNEMAQTVQPALTPTADVTTNASTASGSTTVQERQVNQALDVAAQLPNLGVPMPQNDLQTALVSIALLLALIVAWQLRRRNRFDSVGFDVVTAGSNAIPDWRDAYARRQEGLMGSSGGADRAIVGRIAADEDDEDTSKMVSASDFDFDDEVTYVFTAKVDRQTVGHLVRVTSEPRFPAELELTGSPSMRSGDCEIAIGRHSKHNAVVISDKSVSRQHAAIVRRGEQLFVRDNESTAGTLLNWKQLKTDDELPLYHKDILSFGEAVYEFRAQKEETDGPLTLIPEFAREDTELIEN